MGCTFSGLNALYDSAGAGGDVWINENRFRIVKQLGGSADASSPSLFLVKEILTNSSSADTGVAKKIKDQSNVSDDGTYAMKKVLIHNKEELDNVKEEIRISSLFTHPNLLPLLDHSIIEVKAAKEISWTHEAYLLFPVPMGGTLLEKSKTMKGNGEFFSTSDVLQIFRQLCAGLKHMHSFDPPYAHNDVHPGNIIIARKKGQAPIAKLMDFETARAARKQISSPEEAQKLQEWASKHCSDQFRAPELWNCPSHASIDERTDIWSLGCTLFAIMYHTSPFEHVLEEPDGNLELAVINTQIKKWPPGPNDPYPEALHQFITWMLQPQATVRPRIDDIIPHVDKLIAKFGQ
ncbi:unnamed protein product [Rhodiola kirilowii]